MKKLITAVFLVLFSGQALAAFIIEIYEQNEDIVVSGSGSLNITGMTALPDGWGSDPVPDGYGMISYHRLYSHQLDADFDLYTGFTSFETFIFASTNMTSDISGNSFGLFINSVLVIPQGYISGNYYEGKMIFEGLTLADLNQSYSPLLNTPPTSYEYILPNDSLTVVIGKVPTPAPLALLAIGLAGIVLTIKTNK